MSDGGAGGQDRARCSGTEADFGEYINLQAQELLQVGSLVCALLAQLSHQGTSPQQNCLCTGPVTQARF